MGSFRSILGRGAFSTSYCICRGSCNWCHVVSSAFVSHQQRSFPSLTFILDNIRRCLLAGALCHSEPAYVGTMNTNSWETDLILFKDVTFPCSGLLMSWEYYAAGSGTHRVSVWRANNNGYQRIHMVSIVSSGAGQQVSSVTALKVFVWRKFYCWRFLKFCTFFKVSGI